MKMLKKLLARLDKFLNAHPRMKSFLGGMASINVWPGTLPTYEKRFDTDAERLSSDWKKVEGDIKKALEKSESKAP